MTDEIRITRRVALPDKYEYYELEYKTDETDTDNIKVRISILQDMVAWIRYNYGKPTPEIYASASEPPTYPYDDLLIFEDETVRLKEYLKDKEKWNAINQYLKGMGYVWKAEGKDSRWEMKEK